MNFDKLRNYQEIFAGDLERVRQEKPDAPYNHLVEPLSATLKAAGYDYTARDLAGSFHNQVCGSITPLEHGTTLDEICQQIISAFTMGGSFSNHSYEIRRIIDAELDWRLGFRGGPDMSALGLIQEIDFYLRKAKIRRGTKRYKALIEEKAPKCREILLDDAQVAVDQWRKEITKVIEQERERNQGARNFANHLFRSIGLIAGLEAISTARDKWQIKEKLGAEVAKILSGTEAREKRLKTVEDSEPDLEEVVKVAILASKDLQAMWEASKPAEIV